MCQAFPCSSPITLPKKENGPFYFADPQGHLELWARLFQPPTTAIDWAVGISVELQKARMEVLVLR